ncbi:hypothetical protein BXZ70DRAFT_1073973 [Cristinia sonorae]|uniref:RRM domain-containing protein n=1 Tax=Cristinia sonorae TaxID=1940300 RepID=A0A8K0XJZ6_9AGAR|nr:hypothetical protein BXZ70DRAFT_1073973 [Cristinia sonorae]
MSPSNSYPVQVSNISPTTTEQSLTDFFVFCGHITSVKYDSAAHTATISFEKPQAAKTALMLNGGTLEGSQLTVTGDASHPDQHDDHDKSEHLDQTDKPRAGIAAEYLAKGYVLSDQILERAISLDNEKGISKKFLSYIQSLDTTLGEKTLGKDQTISAKVQETLNQATAQAKGIDEQKGISKNATSYYSRALSSPFGQKVRQFYTSTSKQIFDIHEEARRIADSLKHAQTDKETPVSTAVGTSAPPQDSAVKTGL